MTIMNNTSAMLTLGQLNKNISKVGKDLKKISSGMKLNSAGDDASSYAISERMRMRAAPRLETSSILRTV